MIFMQRFDLIRRVADCIIQGDGRSISLPAAAS